MFISEAYAQTAAAAPGATDMLTSFLPLVLIFVVFWFLMIRPQQKRMKEHRALVSAAKKGDKIVTNGGIIGKIKEVKETSFIIQSAEKSFLEVGKSAVVGRKAE